MIKSIIVIFLLAFTENLFGQGEENTKIYYDYFVVNTSSIKESHYNSSKESLQFTCFPDSIPPESWFKLQYDTCHVFPMNGEKSYMSVYARNEWAINFDRSQLMVLTLINYSSNRQAFCENAPGFTLVRAVINLQVRAENGNWKNIIGNESKERIFNSGVPGFRILNIVCKKPRDYVNTELRYRMLVNSPPYWPTNKYIYSNVFIIK